jgi:hypothetical protein
MGIINENIPSFKALCRLSHMTKNVDDSESYIDVYVFGIQSIPGKILTFHVMTDSGMLRSRVPISELFVRQPNEDVPAHYKQLWDCFGEHVSVTSFDFMAGKRAQVMLKDKSMVWATYMFTVDWFDNPYSDEPSDYKCGHILSSDDGYLLCMPNNRIIWRDSNWITKELPSDLSIYKVDTELISVESFSDRWVSEDTDSFYYDIKSV